MLIKQSKMRSYWPLNKPSYEVKISDYILVIWKPWNEKNFIFFIFIFSWFVHHYKKLKLFETISMLNCIQNDVYVIFYVKLLLIIRFVFVFSNFLMWYKKKYSKTKIFICVFIMNRGKISSKTFFLSNPLHHPPTYSLDRTELQFK